MQTQTAAVKASRKKTFKLKNIIGDVELTILSLPVIIFMLVFSYLPMAGIIVAFKTFRYDKGIFGSDWAPHLGLKNFEFLFKSVDAWRIFRNTVGLNFLFITVGTVTSIVLALMLFEIAKGIYVKIYQTIAILPNFISWVVAGFAFYAIFSPQYGISNHIFRMLGMDPIAWYNEPKYWPIILMFSNIWKYVGMSIVIYYASLMGVEKDYFEAAEIDGATKLQIIFHITIPFLKTMVVILTILNIGNILRADFGMFYQLTRDVGMLYPTTDVIDTYVFRALRRGDIATSSATGLFQSIVGFILVLVTNLVVKKIDEDSSLF